MPRQRHRWEPICDPPARLVRPVPIDVHGVHGPTRGQAAGKKWRRTSHGLYVPADVDPSIPEQRILEMSMLLPAGGAVTGWAALRLRHAAFFDGLLPNGRTQIPVPLIVGPRQGRRDRQGVVWLEDRLDAVERRTVSGIACTTEERSLFDEMRRAVSLREAVVAMDMAAAAELTSIARMRSYLATRSGWLGVPRARAALDLADENSRSPNETRMRLVWQLDAGYPKPLVNQPVWDQHDRLLGYADILDPVAGVVGEFDGADHRGAKRHSADVDREAGFRSCGLEFFRVTGPDLPVRSRVVARMASTRARANWLVPGARKWSLVPPPTWAPAPSLDEILDERDLLRELYTQWERESAPGPNG